MLFPLNPETETCKVFTVLNRKVLYFLEKAIPAEDFSENLFEYNVCWTNPNTKKRFKELWDALPENEADRERIFTCVKDAQEVHSFFADPEKPLPCLPDIDVTKALKSLTCHLFTATKDLVGIKDLATSSITQHYQKFVRKNSKLCYLCGTEMLSQDRAGIDESDQWRGDYDHLLCKDKYPIYAAHPGNFIPTCHTCNSKAKNARDLLQDATGVRRSAFYPLPPLTESCYEYVCLTPFLQTIETLREGADIEPLSRITFSYPDADAVQRGKIFVWTEVYQVPSRVEAHLLSDFVDRILSDLAPYSFGDFCAQLERISGRLPRDYKKSEWRFWWYKFYVWLQSQDESVKADVWAMVQWKDDLVKENNDFSETYGL